MITDRNPALDDRVRVLHDSPHSDVPQTIVTLRHEHRYFESILSALDEQADKAAQGECDLALLRDIVQYLVNYPDAYHHPLEDLVFERLLKADPGSQNAVQSLIDGHAVMYRETKRLRATVEKAIEGEAIHVDRLHLLITKYTEAYRAHMRTEDTVVFPRAIAKLTPEDWAEIGREYRQDQDPLFGSAVRQKYQRLAEGLYSRAELVRRRFAVAEIVGVESTIEGVATLSAAAWDIGRVLVERTKEGTRENLGAVKSRVTSGNPMEIAKLPLDFFHNNRAQLDSGIREIGEILSRAGADIRKPYTTRMESLKGLLRRDWDE